MIWVFCRFGLMCFSLHVSKSGKYHNIKIALRVLWHHFGLWFPTPYTFYLCLEIVPTKYIINEAFFYYYIFMEGNTIIVDLKWNDCDFPIINEIRISKEKILFEKRIFSYQNNRRLRKKPWILRWNSNHVFHLKLKMKHKVFFAVHEFYLCWQKRERKTLCSYSKYFRRNLKRLSRILSRPIKANTVSACFFFKCAGVHWDIRFVFNEIAFIFIATNCRCAFAYIANCNSRRKRTETNG